ncbi:MAG: hypothetical protein IIU50_01640 [Bacteroidaceae bacterium]|nr:hypothetical protein [Bacteroidaceae bacterium]
MAHPPSITNIVHRIATRLERDVNDRLPRRVGVIAVKHFNQKLLRQWILQQWTKTLARDQTTARGKGGRPTTQTAHQRSTALTVHH